MGGDCTFDCYFDWLEWWDAYDNKQLLWCHARILAKRACEFFWKQKWSFRSADSIPRWKNETRSSQFSTDFVRRSRVSQAGHVCANQFLWEDQLCEWKNHAETDILLVLLA